MGPFESKVAYLYITVAVAPSGVACTKVWGGKMFDFRRITLFCLEKRLLKHKMTMFSKNLGGAWPLLPPPATPMVGPLWKQGTLHITVEKRARGKCLACLPLKTPPKYNPDNDFIWDMKPIEYVLRHPMCVLSHLTCACKHYDVKQGFPTFLRSRTTWAPRVVNAYHIFQNN